VAVAGEEGAEAVGDEWGGVGSVRVENGGEGFGGEKGGGAGVVFAVVELGREGGVLCGAGGGGRAEWEYLAGFSDLRRWVPRNMSSGKVELGCLEESMRDEDDLMSLSGGASRKTWLYRLTERFSWRLLSMVLAADSHGSQITLTSY